MLVVDYYRTIIVRKLGNIRRKLLQMFFAKLFTGKFGELLAPSPKSKEEFFSYLKAGLTDKALNVLRNCEEEIPFDVNEIDSTSGMAPIHIACALGAMELVVELLSHGADIGLEASNGCNCLHFASINDRKGIIEILLRSGADRSLPNKEGLLPIELAKTKSVKEMFLRDRSNIFSPIVQTRMLLSDYVEQMQLSPPPTTSVITSNPVRNNNLEVEPFSTKQNLMNEFDDHDNENDLNKMNKVSQETTASSFSPQKIKQSSAEDNYTIVGVSSTKKPPMNSKSNQYINSDDSSDSNSPNTSPLPKNKIVEIPKLNFGKLENLPPPPTSMIPNTTEASNNSSGTNSRSGSINFYHPNGTPVAPEVAVITPFLDSIKPSPRTNIFAHPSYNDHLQSSMSGGGGHQSSSGKLSTLGNMNNTGGIAAMSDSFDFDKYNQDDTELREAVVLAAIQTAHSMQSSRDEFEARRLMIRNCQKVNEVQFRKLLTFDPTLSMSRATEMLSLAADGQTPLHVAAAFGNLKALQIMVELGPPKTFTLWVRDMQGRTPLHVAAEKGHQVVCAYLREKMKLEKQRDPVGEDAPTDLAGTTPLGWAAYGSRGKPKKSDLIDSLFKPGDRSILPKTPVSVRAGKSPWKAPSSVGYDMLARENVVFAFSEANGWTPYMEDRIFVSCPVIGRPAWSFFGVCDGHGGSFSSDFLAKTIPSLLVKEAANLDRSMGSSYLPGGTSNDSDTTPAILKEMLLKISADAEKELSEHPRMLVEKSGTRISTLDGSGSTAVLALVTSQYVAIANVGDSRAVLAQRSSDAGIGNESVTYPFGYSPRGTNTTWNNNAATANTNVANSDIVNTPPNGTIPCITNETSHNNINSNSGTGSGSNSSRCMLTAVGLSRDHKASLPEERERIEKSGAIIEQVSADSDVYQIYTEGSDSKLRMSRSFGDFYLKQNNELPIEEQAVIAIPEIEIHHRTAKDAFLVLACDGIWDVMSNQEVVEYMGEKLGYTSYGGPVGGVTTQRAAIACDALLQACLEKGTVDNISVILIVLGAPAIATSLPLIISKSSIPSVNSSTPTGDINPFLTTPKTITTRVPLNTVNTNPYSNMPSSTLRASTTIEYEQDVDVGVDLPIYNTSNSNQNTGCLNEVFEAVANDISIEDINLEESIGVIHITADDDIPVMDELASPLHTKPGSTKVKKQLIFQD